MDADPNDHSPTLYADEVIYQTNESSNAAFADHASIQNSWILNQQMPDGEQTDTSRIENTSKGCVSKAGSSASIDETKNDSANITNLFETRERDCEISREASSSSDKNGSCKERAAVYHLT